MEKTTAAIAPALVGEHEACKFLDISVSVLRRDRAKAHLKIPLVRIGGSVRYRLDDLRAWVNSQVIYPSAPADADPIPPPRPTLKRSPGRPTNASRRNQVNGGSKS
jgi:Helix-turn-helix domain